MLIAVCALGGGVGAVLLAPPYWTSWQLLVALLLAVDVIGGVAANALPAGRRWYHRPERSLVSRALFFGGHVLHPVLLVLVFDARWEWGLLLFGSMLLAATSVLLAPIDVALAVGLIATTAALTLVLTVFGGPPEGLVWLAVAYFLKLIVGHATPETPSAATAVGSDAAR